MLNFSSPAAWWLALAIVPIIVFYFLRMRFRKQPVSSVYLWSRLTSAIQGSSRFQWRSAWLLLLQIIIAMAAVLALTGPVWKMSATSKPGIIYLIDVSASMTAKDRHQTESRLEQAKQFIEEMIHADTRHVERIIILCASEITPLGSPARSGF